MNTCVRYLSPITVTDYTMCRFALSLVWTVFEVTDEFIASRPVMANVIEQRLINENK